MSLIIPANSLAGGFAIDNSLRFDKPSSDYLSRTPASATNQKTWTLSFWVKKSGLVANNMIYLQDSDTYIYFNTDDRLGIVFAGEVSGNFRTSMLFRDVSAWYHIVIACDTTQGTASNRVKTYVNGSQVTYSTESQPTINYDTTINSTAGIEIGKEGTNYFNGYMAEKYLIDGQALTPTDFGEFDADSGVWKPIAYSGSYGTNGFFLEFQSSGSLGTDSSGNANTFTVNNLTSIDQTTDTPTNNFATLNPLDVNADGFPTFADGNLTSTHLSASWKQARGTYYLTSGKWYWEYKCLAVDGCRIGVCNKDWAVTGYPGTLRGISNDARKFSGSTATSYGITFTTNDIVGTALDLDNGTITFYVNGASQGVAFTDLISAIDDTGWTPVASLYNSNFSINFGNAPYTITTGNADENSIGNFEYSVPSGYLALCTSNLSEVNS